MNMITNSPLLTKKDIQLMLNVSPATVTRLIKKGLLKSIKIGKLVRISEESFNDFIESGKNG